jgi:E3 Ubiquitin ligase
MYMLSISTQILLSISSTNQGKMQLYAVIGAGAGIYLFFRGFKMLQFKRLILNTPTSKVRSASMGLIELTGVPVGPVTIRAGITGDSCYFYRATAWELQRSGNNSTWKRVADESLFVPFFLQDDTGHMLVNAQGADMDVHCNFKDEFGSSFFNSGMPMGAAQDFLLRYGLSGQRVRVEEHCIKPGYPLFVLGTLGESTARWGSTPERHLSAASSSINLRTTSGAMGNGLLQMLGGVPGVQMELNNAKTASGRAAITSSTQPVPSVVAPAASRWSSVSMDEVHKPVATAKVPVDTSLAEMMPAKTPLPPAAVAQPVRSSASVSIADSPPLEASSNSSFALNTPVAIGKGNNGAPFTISSESQRELCRGLGWKSTACIWGGPALTVACVYILFLTLGRW